MLDLTPIKARWADVADGPWAVEEWTDRDYEYDDDDERVTYLALRAESPSKMAPGSYELGRLHAVREADAIAHAREDVPALVAEIERLRALVGESA